MRETILALLPVQKMERMFHPKIKRNPAMRKCFLILIGLVLGFSACSAEKISADLTVGVESYPGNLDPRYPTDAYSAKVGALLFNGLLKLDENLMLAPDLVDRYEYLSDSKLSFHLRSDVYFHDGQKLTSQDVLYTIDSLRDPKKKSPLYAVFQKVKAVNVLDEQNFEIELKEPFAPFLTALTVGIIPQGVDETDEPFAKHPIGTGSFKFDRAQEGQWIRLKANPHYFDGAPELDSLLVRTVRDDTTRVLQLLHGQIDLVQNAVPLVLVEWLRKQSGIQIAGSPGINYVYWAFNLRDPILKNLKVRQAIAHVIDRESLIQYRQKGFVQRATGLLAPENAYYEGEVEQFDYDPALAKRLLDEAGYPDPDGEGPKPRLTLNLKTSTKRDRVALARAMASQLQQVGIELTVSAYEWGTFFRDIRSGNFQIYSSTWVGVTEPDIYYNTFHSSMFPPQGANRGFYQNSEVDRLLEQGRNSTDFNLRKQDYSEVQKIVAHDLPYLSLWYEDNIVFMRDRVEDYSLRPDASWLGLAKARVKDSKPIGLVEP